MAKGQWCLTAEKVAAGRQESNGCLPASHLQTDLPEIRIRLMFYYCVRDYMPLFHVVTITDCPPNSAVDRRRTGLSGCCLSCLERSATARHGCRISAVFCSRLKTHLFRRCFPWHPYCCRVREVTVIPDTLIIFVTYLLTYYYFFIC